MKAPCREMRLPGHGPPARAAVPQAGEVIRVHRLRGPHPGHIVRAQVLRRMPARRRGKGASGHPDAGHAAGGCCLRVALPRRSVPGDRTSQG